MTFRWGYSTRCLPTVNYLTSLDKYSISSLVFIYLCLVWHGSTIFFHKNIPTLVQIDRVILVLLLFIYTSMHVILFIWLQSAYSIRKAMVERDHDFYMHKIHHRSSMISQDNIAAEAAERENGAIFHLPQNTWQSQRKRSLYSVPTHTSTKHPRQQIKSKPSITIDCYFSNPKADGDAPKRSNIRRLSNQFKAFVFSKPVKTSETIQEVHGGTPSSQDPQV